MGCSGSKQQTAGVAAKAAEAGPEGDYKVTLERAADVAEPETLGMTVVGDGNGVFKIQAVKEEGLVPTYNKENEENQVKVGEIIVRVNDAFGDLDAMKKQLLQKTVVLSIKRQSEQAAEPVAAADAEEQPAPVAEGEQQPADAEQQAPAETAEAAETEAVAAAAPEGEAEAVVDAPATTSEAADAPPPTGAAPEVATGGIPIPASSSRAGEEDVMVPVDEDPLEINTEKTERRVCC